MRVNATGLALALTVFLPVLTANAQVAHAVCRPTGDRPESGLSGETTAAEIDAGLPAQGFKCNTDLVGQYQGQGASWQLAAWQNCAYFDQRNPAQPVNPGSPVEANPGVTVLDVSDPTTPNPTTYLQDIAMIDPWESVKVNPARQLLGGGQRPLNGAVANPGDGFSVYSISADCKAPVLQATVHLPGSFGHTGQFTPDGMTYYITPLQASPSMLAVDVSDPTNPSEIPGSLVTFTAEQLSLPKLHDIEFTQDGNTAYITMFGNGATAAGNGIAILDVSDFQQRRSNPMYRVLSQLTWNDGSIGAQNALPITIAGNPYILVSDEGGGGASGCSEGHSANGFPRLIDVSDPTNPQVVAKIQLDVALPENCAYISTAPITSAQTTLTDGGISVNVGPGFFAHSCHYCQVDDATNAKIAGCNCFAAGLRFFDIHGVTPGSDNVGVVKEMAYWKPPAQGLKFLPGSQYANSETPPSFVRNYDWATSLISFPKDRGDSSGDIWTTAQDNGFMVISLYSLVTVSPKTAAITTGSSITLNASVTGAAGTAGVTWSVTPSGGTLSANGGVFTGDTAGTYTLVATSILDTTKTDSATVTVTDAAFPSNSGGCSTAPAGLTLLLAPLGLLLWRVRRRRQ
jgi:hypothetical protein